MPEQPLQELIDGLRTRLQAELETELGALAVSHDRAVEHARRLALEEAEQHWTARLDSAREEWHAQLQSEVTAVRAEADERLAAESVRARIEGEQAAADAAAALRRQFEAAAADEAARIRREAEASAADEAARIRREIADSAGEETARIRREFESAAAEDAARLRRELEASAADSAAQLRREIDAASTERTADIRRQLESAAAGERERAHALAAEREKAERDLAAAEAALAAERQRSQDLLAQAGRAGAESHATRVLNAIGALDQAGSLSDILGLTAAAAIAEAPRAAVFVANGPQLEEWTLPNVPALSPGPVRIESDEAGVMGSAMTSAEPRASGPGGLKAPAFARLPPDRTSIAVPLTLAGQPVGVLYADEASSGDAAEPWRAAVQLLGRHASACLAHLTATRTAQAVRLVSERAGPSRGASAPAHIDDQAARRYARLLVSEIKLYNEGAVRVGREKRDLLRRLKPEIERARRMYDERIPPSVAGRDACFEQELAQTLADGDAALLGS